LLDNNGIQKYAFKLIEIINVSNNLEHYGIETLQVVQDYYDKVY
jgi:4-hydroxyphenylpyruvate dioxygenase-like putative hemolysin